METTINKSICDIDRYETERQICKNCDGAKCLKSDKGYGPFEEAVLFREENGNVRLTHRECVIRLKHFRQEALNQAFTSSKIPKLYQGKTFDDYKLTKGNAKAVEATKKAIETDKGLFLAGNCGCGKTMLAAIAASESLKRGKSVIFAAVPRLLSDIKATFDSEESTLDILRSIESVDLLVLDDLGTEKTTDWTAELLFSIVNARYNDSKQTIITTNYTPEELQMHIAGTDSKWKTTAERILSRICAMCMIAYITGNDWRMA